MLKTCNENKECKFDLMTYNDINSEKDKCISYDNNCVKCENIIAL